MAEHESRLIEQDKRLVMEVFLNQEYVLWLRQVFVPGLWRYAELRTQYIGEPEIRGWHTTIMRAHKWSEEQYWLMSLMLMGDPGKNL